MAPVPQVLSPLSGTIPIVPQVSPNAWQLLVYVGDNDYINPLSDEMLTNLEANRFTVEPMNSTSLVTILSSDSFMDVKAVLVTKAEEDRAVLQVLNKYAQRGGTVICALGFQASIQNDAIPEFFKRLGVPSWKAGGVSAPETEFVKETTKKVSLSSPKASANVAGNPLQTNERKESNRHKKRPLFELMDRSVNPLPDMCRMRALQLQVAPLNEAIYFERPTKDDANHTKGIRAAVTFAHVQKGWVGYIGELDNGMATESILQAMIGLSILGAQSETQAEPEDGPRE
ncbi:hypothetical protein M408DRAFT_327754 [Serendipita vermifera MAFF 305830]|uniref:Uncharacterized protein n=1 Tax=Serendipita vermifera MAFF 305830 TaxID=933852 RepID=A0A0C3B1P9_SERVB|nr:hypothetical protein M408DRAFT_327754 [Serendipita vermifera MAFF 305830]